MKTRILALDLATQTGWALHASGVTDHGSQSFHRKTGRKRVPDEHEGVPFLLFVKWLRERVAQDKPDLFVYERPGHFASASAAFMACGLRGILYQTAAYYDIPVVAYSPSAIKKWATGKGGADKDAMKRAARSMSNGETFADDNAADAYLLLKFHLSRK